jgi:hypothetical protein
MEGEEARRWRGMRKRGEDEKCKEGGGVEGRGEGSKVKRLR